MPSGTNTKQPNNATFTVFDLGNVVLTNDWHFDCSEKDRAFTSHFHISDNDMERGWKAAWDLYSRGEISEEIFWTRFLTAAGTSILDINKAKELYREYQFEIEHMLGLLSRLKQSGCRLASLTNIGKEWLEFKRKKFILDAYFDTIVSSCDTGFRKPEPEIFQSLLSTLKVRPEQCLLVDDHVKTTEQAERIGMHAIVFQNQRKLEEQLRQRGYIFPTPTS